MQGFGVVVDHSISVCVVVDAKIRRLIPRVANKNCSLSFSAKIIYMNVTNCLMNVLKSFCVLNRNVDE